MNGYLLIDKPLGITSHDVVAKIRRILATEARIEKRESRIVPNSQFPIPPSAKPKVGHTGTLDPLASGLMILVLGSYTKRAQEFSKMDKTYEAELTLGSTSATGDGEGPITGYPSSVVVAAYSAEAAAKVGPQLRRTGSGQVTGDSKKPSEKEVRKVLETFIGEISQTPHAHSAVKIGGQRAYKLARAGKKPELKPRQVTVYRLQVTEYNYPKLKFITEVSSGTYIRSLAEDIGSKLGTGAYVSALRRTTVGKFDIKNAENLEKLDTLKLETGVVKK